MKKVLISFVVVVILLLFVALPLMRISPFHLDDVAGVGAGIGAKLACSGRYITGQSDQQVMDDLASYSPATRTIDIQYDDQHRQVTATMLGLSPTTAKFRDGIGCTLAFGDTQALDDLEVPEMNRRPDSWPLGDKAEHIDKTIQDLLDAQLQQDNLDGYESRALLVIKQGKLVAESYAPGYDEKTSFLGWSMGKSVTSIMLGRLDYKKTLDVSSTHLFEDWSEDERAAITLQSMLQMSSGLDFSEQYAPGSDSTRMLFTEGSASNVAMESQLEHPVGEHFSYSSGTTNLLARYLSDQLGSKVQHNIDFLYRELLEPLNMHDTLFEPDASGVFVGSSYIYASARDWAKLGLLMINEGLFNGQRLLTEDWVKRSYAPNHSQNDKRYGYQFWLNSGEDELRWNNLPADAYAMLGSRSQIVMIIPSKELVIVRLGWTSGFYPTNDVLGELVKQVQ
jgi:CubicO group peptidase (beta-lactamase class C family)